MSIYEIASLSPTWPQVPEMRKKIHLKMLSQACLPEHIVDQLASIEGPVDIYFWYEGSQCLPKAGAAFMKTQIFVPLYKLKPDAKLYLYSLKAWDFKKNITTMPSSTPLGDAINRINKTALECLYSSSFFQYCLQASRRGNLYAFISEALPKKEWLFKLSDTQRKSGKTVDNFFGSQSSLFDCIKDLDLSFAYSAMQYIEGYYLIRESVKRGLTTGQKKVEIAFVLPNDESKYYLDLPKDIEKMLQLDFGNELSGVTVNISFRFFQYGDSLISRPYIDKRDKAAKVNPKDVESYFDYLVRQEQSKMLFLRDVIHKLNEWN